VTAVPDPQFAVNAAAALVRSLGCSNVQATLLYVGDAADAPSIHFPVNPALQWRWMFRGGIVEEEILRAAEEYNANLIVMGTEGHRNVLDVLRGDTTEHVVRHAKCPILAVPVLRQDLQESLMARLVTGQTTI
jgi:nucleotide-binding universal stress UspA family protein